MADNSNQYPNSKVYLEQGAEKLVGKSGGTLDAESGFGFLMKDTTFTSNRLEGLFNYHFTKTVKQNSAGVLSAHGGSSPPVLQSGGGTFILVLDSTASNASARIPSAQSGQIMFIDIDPSTSEASVLIVASNSGFTGVSVEGIKGSALSAFALTQAGSDAGYVKLACIDDGTWAIVDRSVSSVTEYPAA